MICSFFGHSDCPKEVEGMVEKEIERLIVEESVTEFIVGDKGCFDMYVLKVLRRLKEKYNIKYSVILSYLPAKRENEHYTWEETWFPDCLEKTPRKFAISKRNKWMVDNSDVVITYVHSNISRALIYKEYAEKKGIRVINIQKL